MARKPARARKPRGKKAKRKAPRKGRRTPSAKEEAVPEEKYTYQGTFKPKRPED